MARREEAVYIISVAAERAGIHPQTLRIYERRGLISPYRTPGGTRRYSDADLDRLEAIQALTAAGVNLEGVKRILELEGVVEELERAVKRVKAELADAKTAASESLSNLPDILRPTIEQLFGD
jgi:MerR family transcriptional regulator/heat shock protein HspR